jgi:type II secretory ATPase GspE/PulE/Tfp pilus assembly ATPase PilB-like protein
MGIEPYLVASTLELVMAQRLVRLLCPACKRALAGPERTDALRAIPGFDGAVFGPVGCHDCGGFGYSGRSGIFEMMPMSPALRHAAGERGSSQELRELAEREGLVSLRDDGLRLVREGRTSVAEVLRNTHQGILVR